jgi:hypothetical protein
MNNISKHISYKEAINSYTAIKLDINNIPNKQQLANMKMIAKFIFEPLRKGLGNIPINIPSFFRCKKLNTLIGGANGSQHMALNNSAAIDLDVGSSDIITNLDIANYIINNLEWDQLILEDINKDGMPNWIHVSFRKNSNRKQILTMIRKKGKATYKDITNNI